jgi:high-affinity iron transporter
MFQAFIIVLREGFEAFLIVAITIAFLRRAGRTRLISATYGGAGAGVLASVALGWLLTRSARLPLWEGFLGLLALPLVGGLVVHMWRTGPRMRSLVETRLERRVGDHAPGGVCTAPHARAALGVFGFAAIMVAREGMETALLLFQLRNGPMLAGAALGLLAALALAALWTRVGPAIDLRRFFQVTGVFLLIFAVQLAITAVHELAEAGVLPSSALLHAVTEAYGPEGVYGRWLGFATVAVPALWLGAAWLAGRAVGLSARLRAS